MRPTPSEAVRASLSQCFQKALATPRTEPAPPLEQQRGQMKGESPKYSLADLFVGINPPPPEVLKDSNPDHSARGRATTRLEWPPEEKKRRSSSRPWGEVEPKRSRSSGAKPSWDVSKFGSRQSDKARSQPASEPKAPTPPPKLKSAVKTVRLNLPKPEDLESLGPAARSRYDDSAKDDWPHRDKSQHHSDAHNRSRSKSSGRSDRGSGRHDRRSGQSSNSKSAKQYPEESLGTKLAARKEHEKWCKKIVDNTMLYLEERQHQILPEEHQPEIHSLRFFGPGAERAAIEILAIINWVAEFVKISRSPVPEIPGFLKRPFIKGKLVNHPILDDPSESIHKEMCVRTKAQKSWTYLCALLQFWTDEATTESGDVMYGGRCRPANPMIVWIRATLHPSFGDHFKITWASIAASTSWTQGPPLLWRVAQGVIPVGARPHGRSTKPTGSCGRRKMGKVPQGGSARDPGLEFLYFVSGRHRFHAPSVIRTVGGSATDGSSASDGSLQCASRVRPHSLEDPGGAGSSKI